MPAEALAAIKVVEFGAYAAGPCIGKHLANFGATVVHVESRQRPDGFRLQYPPYKDDVVGVNRSGCFALFNDSKYGITLNLKAPGAAELAHRLVGWADVVIENFTPGTMARLGLGYAALQEVNPRLVMLSTCNMGQTGARARHPGFGSQLSALAGFTGLIGFADGPPQFLYGPYIDFVAVAFGAVAVLAALDHRRRTGQGQWIDLSQYEAGLQFLSGALLAEATGGDQIGRDGNRCPEAVPHGAYPCRDGMWCVLSCHDDAQWQRLVAVMGRPAWATEPELACFEGRRQRADDLDRLIAAWTGGQDARDLFQRLQAAGIHAGVVNTVADLFSDPQLAVRGVWQAQDHPEIGRHHYRGPSYHLSATPGRVRGPAPCLGEHNKHVYRELLGLTQAQYQDYKERGVID